MNVLDLIQKIKLEQEVYFINKENEKMLTNITYYPDVAKYFFCPVESIEVIDNKLHIRIG